MLGVANTPTQAQSTTAAGGVRGTGQIRVAGGESIPGHAPATNRVVSSIPGASLLSPIESRGTSSVSSAGQAGSAYGGGGRGPHNRNNATASDGQPGADGIVIIEIFG